MFMQNKLICTNFFIIEKKSNRIIFIFNYSNLSVQFIYQIRIDTIS